jgi:putative transposase
MPRRPRVTPGGFVYHALNRSVARLPLFQKDGDYDAFERVLAEALQEHPTRILASGVMPNHWHFVLWPRADGELTAFLRWLTHTHTMRWHTHYHTAGTGHLYQGRFKAFPIQEDDHLYTVLRYVERNPLRAGLVARAGQWRWSSLWRRQRGDGPQQALLHPWPVPLLEDWEAWVNQPQTEGELAAVRQAVVRGSPFGSPSWQERTARRLGLEFTLRPRGRPKKKGATRRESRKELRPLFFSPFSSRPLFFSPFLLPH